MKRYFILALIATDPVAPGLRPELLTKPEELERFETMDEASRFLDEIRLRILEENALARFIEPLIQGKEGMDYRTAHAYADLMAMAETNDNLGIFRDIVQKAAEFRPGDHPLILQKQPASMETSQATCNTDQDGR